MASYRIPAIEGFEFTKPEEWPRWIRRFERFREASDLKSKNEAVQVSTLVYSMGDKAEDLLQSFALSKEDSKKYNTVKGKFENYFGERRNTIYERAKFNRRKQEDKETVAAVRKTGQRARTSQRVPRFKPRRQERYRCSRCGKSPLHAKQECPARDVECHKCHKIGHFMKFCRTKMGLKEVTEGQDSSSDDKFLGTVTIGTAKSPTDSDPWKVQLNLNNRSLDFKVDTGADVTVIPERSYSASRDGELKHSKLPVVGPTGEKFIVRGKFTGTLCNPSDGRSSPQEIYVIKDLRHALLGRPAIEALRIVAKVWQVQKSDMLKKYAKVFKGLGRLKDSYVIKLRENASPFALTTPRRVAMPLVAKVKEELQRMEQMGVITRVDEPTEWCAGMVVVPKPNGKVRICVDLTKLNENVVRERLILPTVEQTLAQIGGAKHFSKLDANSGYWQIELHPDSRKLTTFITPCGRFCFNRLPFGITSAPEHFQRRMSQLLEDIEGVVCLVDDILVTGKTQEEHDSRLNEVLDRCQKAGLTMGLDKCQINQKSVKFLGQIVDGEGVRPDPEKVNAIKRMTHPTNVSELRRFLGLVNQQSKFSPHLADQMKPLGELLSSKNMWNWGPQQQQAFENLKDSLSSSQVLAQYQVDRDTVISADASSYGLGAVIRQVQPDGKVRPIAYASRALTETEQRYAQIEKEALAVTWGCERFQQYLLGKSFKVETDHKPLVPLLSTKSLDSVPLRVQRFRLRLMRFSFTIVHVPGKDLNTADTLSRAPIKEAPNTQELQKEDVKAYVDMMVNSLPASKDKLQLLRNQQADDRDCSQLITFCKTRKIQWTGTLKSYYHVRDELNMADGLLMRGSQIVIPATLREDTLERLNTGHQGMTKCRQRARDAVWWPGIKRDIENKVSKCLVCCKFQVQRSEPLIPSEMPDRPWQKVGSDLFELKNGKYLLVVDYYSRYIEIVKLSSTTSTNIITHLKAIFARHGIPQVFVSDNGPQYSADVFESFAKEYGFKHLTSSPKYPQANGAAERAVKTVKQLLKKNTDPYLALLSYRDTPLENGYSPAELLMGRKLRTNLPIEPSQLKPKLLDQEKVKEKEKKIKEENEEKL